MRGTWRDKLLLHPLLSTELLNFFLAPDKTYLSASIQEDISFFLEFRADRE